MQGKIIRGIAGFYYVHCNEVYECKAKGVFRRNQEKPLVGDNVEMTVLDEENNTGNITAILPRKNSLIRPAVANVDQALVIFAMQKPEPNYNLLDRFLIMMQQKDIACLICFNKDDYATPEEKQQITKIYEATGFPVLTVSAREGTGIDDLKKMLTGKTTTVAGPSGVGKSSLINVLQSSVQMETGEISSKIERGKHTTRHSELIAIEENTYILDTPGFSSLGVFDCEKEDVTAFYAEFAKWEPQCRFGGCMHMKEPDCGVKKALEEGKISRIRYENYSQIVEECSRKKKY